ncbi:hypothetical protein HYH02_004946 [Chlamydomonas schloesseri]|uniref:Beta-glucosidase n=1 Tax=Chlamydomonas schloesseri TaxID=2026947 RepID=A0A836B8K6_9CHLO|nr:hypothetical protein HYH02_004946 [Chlamydomonas schloesseri]|eukprot:KAG2450444.1 hypothetical protein HYH02_004946 [Chlamydomonas schloesseri]
MAGTIIQDVAGDVCERFLKGAAISVWQNSFDEASNWTAFALKPHSLAERMRGKDPQLRMDTSPDFWNRYHEDIQCCRLLGSNSLRLSLEWSRVMPNGPGQVDEEAVRRYTDILDACAAAGLVPMLTLHHFTHPQWFQQLGGFEKEENIRYFEEWAVTAFKLFRRHMSLVATFNEPTCAAFTGYIAGIHAPGHRGDIAGAGRVLLHMLRAHSAAYAAIKAQEGGSCVRVGLVHQQITFEPEGTGMLYAASRWTADWLTHCFGWDVVHTYLLTGRFSWRIPGGRPGQLEVQEPGGRPHLDWLGINYYTRVVLDWRLGFTCRPGEVLTDMGWPVVPEGLHAAIAHCAELGVPLYITETGLADGADDRRAPLIAAYWEQVARAVADGYDVRGFFYWTLVDNYEWHLGYNMKFGLFEWLEAPANAQPHPAAAAQRARATAAASKAACSSAAASRAGATATGVAPTTGPELQPLRITAGPSKLAGASATIISVTSPSTPKWRRTENRADAEEEAQLQAAADRLAASLASAPSGLAASSTLAAAEAACCASVGGDLVDGSSSSRRLRQGSLELVRRFAATPDELGAAQESLRATMWPPLELPQALRRPFPSAGGGLGVGISGAVGVLVAGVAGLLMPRPLGRALRSVARVALTALYVPVLLAGAAWRHVARGAGAALVVRGGYGGLQAAAGVKAGMVGVGGLAGEEQHDMQGVSV